MLRGKVSTYKLRSVGFCDNNIGGDLAYLRTLCAALKPLKLQWYGAATFNIIANRELVRTMAESGCRALFVGLESFNPATLAAMNKHQNVLRKVRAAIAHCRDEGILVVSGLMVSPTVDDVAYIERIPEHLRASGLHVPTFVCFETPIPGTPHFAQLAAQAEGAFLPDALLRDFTGYTLVVRPKHATAEAFVAAYRKSVAEVYSPLNKLRKLADDLPRFLRRGFWLPALVDAVDVWTTNPVPASDRTLIAGSDSEPPERVPLSDADFSSEEQQRAIMEPWRVTNGKGRPLPGWLSPRLIAQRRRRAA